MDLAHWCPSGLPEYTNIADWCEIFGAGVWSGGHPCCLHLSNMHRAQHWYQRYDDRVLTGWDASSALCIAGSGGLSKVWGGGAGAAIKREEEGGELAHCTFAPKTGRGPTSGPKATIARLPAPTRLYAHHDSKYRQVCAPASGSSEQSHAPVMAT